MEKLKGFFYAGLSAATYGLVPLFSVPIIDKGVNYDNILCFRFLIASLIIAAIMGFKKIPFKVSLKEFGTLASLGVFFASCAIFLLMSYKFMATGIATTILFLYPLFVSVMMAVFFKERMGYKTATCMGVAIAGVAALYWGGDSPLSAEGVLYVIISGLSYALYIVVVNKSNVSNMGGLKLTFYSMLIAGLLFLVKGSLGMGIYNLPDMSCWINMVLLSTIPTVISCVTLVYAVQLIGSTNTSIFGALDPLTAIVVGIFVFSDPFSVNMAFGIIMILASVTAIIVINKKK